MEEGPLCCDTTNLSFKKINVSCELDVNQIY